MITTGPFLAPNGVQQWIVWDSPFDLAVCTTYGRHTHVGKGKQPEWYLFAHETEHIQQWCWLGGQDSPLRFVGYVPFLPAYATIGNLGRIGGGLNFFERTPTAFGLRLYQAAGGGNAGNVEAIQPSDPAEVIAWKKHYAAIIATRPANS